MRNGLARLEAQLERLVEGTLARLLAGHLRLPEVIVALSRAMEDGAVSGGAPDRYVVRLNPADAAALQAAESDIEAALSEELVILAREAGLKLSTSPAVRLIADTGVLAHQVQVEVDTSEVEAETSSMTPATGQPPAADTAPRGFLIVDGERHVPLAKPVVSLGRRLDNDVVLDDSRVSRHHAQIRQRHGRWVLYDLNSRGGTLVNDQPVAECVLHPGDVVALAGVTLIYGEDSPVDDAAP